MKYFNQAPYLSDQKLFFEYNIMCEKTEYTISTKALQEYQNLYSSPITLEVMKQPWTLLCQHTFELWAIRKELARNEECPLCKAPSIFKQGSSNLFAKQSIELFQQQKKRKEIKFLKLACLAECNQVDHGFGSDAGGNDLYQIGCNIYSTFEQIEDVVDLGINEQEFAVIICQNKCPMNYYQPESHGPGEFTGYHNTKKYYAAFSLQNSCFKCAMILTKYKHKLLEISKQ